MKCIVLAGGRGDRLWPLSRKNYPKQFISLDGSHSIFQDTIARNMAYCDEFVVVTNREYQFIVENQLKAFQGLTWRLVLEEEARKTTAAILLACLEFPLSELIFIVPSDHLIQGEAYKDAINEAGVLAREGNLVTFGMPVRTVATIGVRALEILSMVSGKNFFASIDQEGQQDVSRNGSSPVATSFT